MTISEKIAAIRQYMSKAHVDAHIIPSSDPHQSEYVSEYWQIRQWASGFTGSAGTFVITKDFAGLWTDSRYIIQATSELEGTEIEVMQLEQSQEPEYQSWLVAQLSTGCKVGIDGQLFSMNEIRQMVKVFSKSRVHLDTTIDIASKVWVSRPTPTLKKAEEHDVHYTGISRAEKLADIRTIMAQKGAHYHLMSSLDDIAWTFNLRGGDIAYNPLVICYALVAQHKATLFIDAQKLTPELRLSFSNDNVSVAPYHAIGQILSAISGEKTVLLDPNKVNHALYSKVRDKAILIEDINIPTLLKSRKNEVEATHIRHTMVKDGVAMVRFLKWIEETIGNELITEISASKKLYEFRKQQDGFRGESFATISAFQEHAALPHYSATNETNIELLPDGIYLVDSGGHYLGGTTDITRTIALGVPSTEEKIDFTFVLKGHIALAQTIFPDGTKGHQLDSIARMPLWQAGLDYGHGTGHGVGYFLNVHEGPQSISTRANTSPYASMREGMVTSNEPGVYRKGKHGIRIENLVLTQSAGESEFGDFLRFETLTLCPIDLNLMDRTLLIQGERKWLNSYHNRVFEKLAPHLSEEEVVWLNRKTKEI